MRTMLLKMSAAFSAKGTVALIVMKIVMKIVKRIVTLSKVEAEIQMILRTAITKSCAKREN